MAARPRLKLTSLPGFDTDIYALPTPEARKMALDMLVLIRDGRVRGVALGKHIQTGDLSDCYKLYFDPDGSGKPRFRLVYRYTPNELQAIALEAVAVGPRNALEVYLRAARRLGRT
ncbi:hypothetical protein [Microbacterium sp.]|uniref:hypothetical protein n=1 Tax=Microbacterium sp. TaxID=51671 RepID=UPI0039E64DA8